MCVIYRDEVAQGEDPYTDYTSNGVCEDGGPGSVADLCGKKGEPGSGLGLDCTDCGTRYLAPPPPPPPPPRAPPPSPPLAPRPTPMSVEFPIYMYVDQYYTSTFMVKLSTGVCSTLMSLLPAEYSVYEATCVYAVEDDEVNIFESSFPGGVADVRSCPEESFTETSLADCTSDVTDAFVNPSNPDGGAFPLPYGRFDVSILTASEPDAEALIAALTAPTADNWSLGRALDQELYDNLIPSSGGRTRIAANPIPISTCPEVEFSHSANGCCYSAPIIFSASSDETWQASCIFEPYAVAAQSPPSSPPAPLPPPPPALSPAPSPPLLPMPPPPPSAPITCDVCGSSSKGCNCCYVGGSWEGQCSESGPLTYDLGFELCEGACV